MVVYGSLSPKVSKFGTLEALITTTFNIDIFPTFVLANHHIMTFKAYLTKNQECE